MPYPHRQPTTDRFGHRITDNRQPAPEARPDNRTPTTDNAAKPQCYDPLAMIRFEDILDKVESYKPDFDEELLDRAFVFSAREHRGQVRSSGGPYLVHPLTVAHTLAQLLPAQTSLSLRPLPPPPDTHTRT